MEQVNTERMAALLDMSPQRLRELARRGVVPKVGHGRFDPAEAVPAYCRHIREQAAGRAAAGVNGEALDLVTERAKLARAQRLKTELEIAATRKALIPAAEVEESGRRLGVVVVSGLNNLPPRLADQVAGMSDPHEIHQLIQSECDFIIEDVRAHFGVDDPSLEADPE